MSDEDDLSDLRDASRQTSRLDEPDRGDDVDDFQDALVDVLAAIDAGEQQPVMSIRDAPLAALLNVLEDRPDERDRIGRDLERHLDRQPSEEYDRSQLVRLLARVGLQEGVPDVWADLADAQATHAKRSL